MATKEAFIPEKNLEVSEDNEKTEDGTSPKDAESNKAKIPHSGNGRQMVEYEGVPKLSTDEKETAPDSEISVEPLPPHVEETSAVIENKDNEVNEGNAVEESVASSDTRKEDSEEFVDAVNELPEKDEIVENEVNEKMFQKEVAFVCGAVLASEQDAAIVTEKYEGSLGSESEDDKSDEENCSETVENEIDSSNFEYPENYDPESFIEGDVDVSEIICDGPEELPEASVESQPLGTDEDLLEEENSQENANDAENLICKKLAEVKLEDESDCKEGGDESPITEAKLLDAEQPMKNTETPEQDSDTVESHEGGTA